MKRVLSLLVAAMSLSVLTASAAGTRTPRLSTPIRYLDESKKPTLMCCLAICGSTKRNSLPQNPCSRMDTDDTTSTDVWNCPG